MDGVDSYVLLDLLDSKIIVYVRNMLEPGLGIQPWPRSFVLKAFFGLVIGIVAIFHAKLLLCPVPIHAAKASIGAIVFNNQVCLSLNRF
jgi:hypothetical protein